MEGRESVLQQFFKMDQIVQQLIYERTLAQSA